MQNLGFSATQWQGEVLRAFQAWSAVADLDVSLVEDDGLPYGATETDQFAAGFGDIRVFARPLSADVLGISSLPQQGGGTRRGDIILNSEKAFRIGGTGSGYDLFTVLLQESGHALGMSNSAQPGSVMYAHYQGAKAELTAGDVAAVRTIYGAKPTEITTEDAGGNNSLQLAQTLAATAPGRFTVRGELHGANDRDFYKVAAPELNGVSSGRMSIVLRRVSGEALPTLTVYTPSGGTLSATTRLANGDVRWIDATVSASTSGYGIRVSGAEAGEYELSVTFSSSKSSESTEVASGQFTQNNNVQFGQVTIRRSTAVQLTLAALGLGDTTMTVYTSAGQPLLTLAVRMFGITSGVLLLNPGEYVVRLTGTACGGSPNMLYSLTTTLLSDPIGVILQDPTGEPPVEQKDYSWAFYDYSRYDWLLGNYLYISGF